MRKYWLRFLDWCLGDVIDKKLYRHASRVIEEIEDAKQEVQLIVQEARDLFVITASRVEKSIEALNQLNVSHFETLDKKLEIIAYRAGKWPQDWSVAMPREPKDFTQNDRQF